ncbi:MAG: phasin family protein [Beijerinckiaceae bacterium]|nr:phasin family protein [Beijerinckiaceae bacterium]
MTGINEDPVPAADDTVAGDEDTALAIEPSAPAEYEESLALASAPPAEEFQAGPGAQSMASIAEVSETGPIIEPAELIAEAAVMEELEVLEKPGREGLKAAATASSVLESFQLMAAEATDYAKTCIDNRAAFIGAVLGAKSVTSAIQVQTSYTKSAVDRYLAHRKKIRALYWNLIREACKPAVKVTAKANRV